MGSQGRGNKLAQRRRKKLRQRALRAEVIRPERIEIECRAADYQTSIERRSKRAAVAVLGVMGAGIVAAVLAALGVL